LRDRLRLLDQARSDDRKRKQTALANKTCSRPSPEPSNLSDAADSGFARIGIMRALEPRALHGKRLSINRIKTFEKTRFATSETMAGPLRSRPWSAPGTEFVGLPDSEYIKVTKENCRPSVVSRLKPERISRTQLAKDIL